MQPHPDFAETDLPRRAEIGAFQLTPLSPAQVDEDFEAVIGSKQVLRGLFGDDWPLGLTRDDNLTDMGWHEREFTAKRSFAWIIRDPGGRYLGCAYLYPDLGKRGHGQVVTWVRDSPDRIAQLTQFDRLFQTWLRSYLPDGYILSWLNNADIS